MEWQCSVNPFGEAIDMTMASPSLQTRLKSAAAANQAKPGCSTENAAEINALRRDGLTRTLPGDAAERFFAIGFALEQMHSNVKDLERCVAEWAGLPKGNRGATAVTRRWMRSL
jgi:hypothetical protein